MFVKPNAIINDSRTQDAKDADLSDATSRNLFFIQQQLVLHGHSLEEVLVLAAKHFLGVNIALHAPIEKKAA